MRAAADNVAMRCCNWTAGEAWEDKLICSTIHCCYIAAALVYKKVYAQQGFSHAAATPSA
jgi:hypothetical protein